MLLSAAGIAFGHGGLSRICCFIFSLLKGFLLLLDQTKYNNHEYLYSTLSLFLYLCDCHDIKEYSLSSCLSLNSSWITAASSCCLVGSLLFLMLNNAVYGIPGTTGLGGVGLMWVSLILL